MSVKKHIASTFLTRILTIILSVGTSIFTTRLLGLAGKGEFSIFLATLHIGSLVLGLGLQPAISYFSARKELNYNSTYFTNLIYAAGITVAFFLVMHTVNQFSDTSIFLHKNRNSIGYEILLCVCLFMTVSLNNMKAVFSGEKLFPTLNRIQTNSVVTGLILYGIMFFGNERWWDIPVWTIFVAHLVIIFLNFLYGNYSYLKNLSVNRAIKLLSIGDIKKVRSFAKLAYVGNIVQFLNYRVDYWFVDYYYGSKELGIYSLSSNIVQMLWILPQSIAAVFLPYIASGAKGIVANIASVARISVIAAFLISLIIFPFMEYIIVFLYGDKFQQSAFVLNILLVGIVPFSLSIIYASYFTGINRQDINMKSAIIGLVATISLDLILIPKYGAHGAAFASGCSYIVSTLYLLLMLKSIAKLSVSDMIMVKKSDFVLVRDKVTQSGFYSKLSNKFNK